MDDSDDESDDEEDDVPELDLSLGAASSAKSQKEASGKMEDERCVALALICLPCIKNRICEERSFLLKPCVNLIISEVDCVTPLFTERSVLFSGSADSLYLW